MARSGRGLRYSAAERRGLQPLDGRPERPPRASSPRRKGERALMPRASSPAYPKGPKMAQSDQKMTPEMGHLFFFFLPKQVARSGRRLRYSTAKGRGLRPSDGRPERPPRASPPRHGERAPMPRASSPAYPKGPKMAQNGQIGPKRGSRRHLGPRDPPILTPPFYPNFRGSGPTWRRCSHPKWPKKGQKRPKRAK